MSQLRQPLILLQVVLIQIDEHAVLVAIRLVPLTGNCRMVYSPTVNRQPTTIGVMLKVGVAARAESPPIPKSAQVPRSRKRLQQQLTSLVSRQKRPRQGRFAHQDCRERESHYKSIACGRGWGSKGLRWRPARVMAGWRWRGRMPKDLKSHCPKRERDWNSGRDPRCPSCLAQTVQTFSQTPLTAGRPHPLTPMWASLTNIL